MTNERCINWPCAKGAGHAGPCGTSRDELSSKELLPCAHCGGAAQLTEVEPMHYVVECSEPMCNMSTRVYISAMDDSRPLAIEAWNRRVAVEPPASEIEAEIMEQLGQRTDDRLCVEALALIQRLRMRAPSAADHYDCAACDQPGEHCARPHGMRSAN